jgi:hypothetical protein
VGHIHGYATFLITVVGGRVTVRLQSTPKIPLLGIPTAGEMMAEGKVLALTAQLGFWLGMLGGSLEGCPEGFFDSLGLLEGLHEGLPETGFALGLLDWATSLACLT